MNQDEANNATSVRTVETAVSVLQHAKQMISISLLSVMQGFGYEHLCHILLKRGVGQFFLLVVTQINVTVANGEKLAGKFNFSYERFRAANSSSNSVPDFESWNKFNKSVSYS